MAFIGRKKGFSTNTSHMGVSFHLQCQWHHPWQSHVCTFLLQVMAVCLRNQIKVSASPVSAVSAPKTLFSKWKSQRWRHILNMALRATFSHMVMGPFIKIQRPSWMLLLAGFPTAISHAVISALIQCVKVISAVVNSLDKKKKKRKN